MHGFCFVLSNCSNPSLHTAVSDSYGVGLIDATKQRVELDKGYLISETLERPFFRLLIFVAYLKIYPNLNNVVLIS